MALEGILGMEDMEFMLSLISANNATLFSSLERAGDDADDEVLRRLVAQVVRSEKMRREAVLEAHKAHESPSWITIPKELLNLLQVAEAQRIVEHDGAIAICDAYVQNNELVHAAWEAYEITKDQSDLLDTLIRIIRSGTLQQQQHPHHDGGEVAAKATSARDSGLRASHALDDALAPYEDMLVIQNVIMQLTEFGVLEPDQADTLQRLVEERNRVLHAAFEVYASDKDYSELIDTLTMLATSEARKTAESSDEDDDDEEDDEDDDDDEDADELPLAVRELADLSDCLLEDNKVNVREHRLMMSLIMDRDPRVLGAYDVYTEFQDVDDLVDTLMRVMKNEMLSKGDDENGDDGESEMRTQVSAGTRSDDAVAGTSFSGMDEEEEDDDDNDDDEEEEEDDEPLDLSQDDRKEILAALYASGTLDADEAVALLAGLDSNDEGVDEAFDVFEVKRDRDILLDALKDIAERLQDEVATPVTMGELAQRVGDEETAGVQGPDANGTTEQSDVTDDEGVDDDEDSNVVIADVFASMVNEMSLSEEETTALRLCVVRNDVDVRAALEVFRLEHDKADLQDSLKRIARRTLHDVREEMLRECEAD